VVVLLGLNGVTVGLVIVVFRPEFFAVVLNVVRVGPLAVLVSLKFVEIGLENVVVGFEVIAD
jgi:hypothetical protein